MPDWLTHMGIAYLVIWSISKVPKYDKLRPYFWLFVIGMVAPDIERIIRIVAEEIGNAFFLQLSYSITTVSHSILGVVIISLFITAFFPHEKDLKFLYFALFIGGIGHLLVDLIMWPWPGMGIYLFYPLTGSEFAFSFHLVWPGGFLPLIVVSCCVLVTIGIDLIQRNFSVFNFKFLSKKEGRIV